MKNIQLAASNVQIDVLIVIDTEYIKRIYPNPSKDPNNPTGINHSSQYMVCYDPRGIVSGQGTADLNFKANAGDYVAFRATSVYQNSDDAVIVYGIKYWSGTQVFNQFVPDLVNRQRAVMPDVTTPNGIPPVLASINFTSYDSKIAKSGTENFYVNIGLYVLDTDGQTQKLFGYFYWDPTVTVS